MDETESFLYFNTFTCGSFIIYLLVIFMHGGQSESAERNIFLVFFSVGPLLSFFFYRTIQQDAQSNHVLLRDVLFCFYGYLLIVFMLILAFISQNIYVMYMFCLIHLPGTLFIYKFCQSCGDANEKIMKVVTYCNNFLFLLFPSIFICFSILFNSDVREYLIENISRSSAFQTGLLGGLLIVLFIFISQWKAKNLPLIKISKYQKTKVVLTLAICLISPFFLFDVNLHFSESNYNVYLGPATAVLGGHLPLVDIYCMYGLSYLLFSFLFKFIISASYAGAATIVSLVNVIFYITFLLIVRRISNQNILIIALGVLALFFYQLVMPHNIVSTPSVAGFRFLPPLLLLFAVVSLPDKRIFNMWTLLASALCILWSFECLVYGIITYAAFMVLHGLLEKIELIRIVKHLFFLAFLCFGVHILLASFLMLLSGGNLPDYNVYFDMIGAHISSTGKEAWSWSLLADPTYLVWILFFVIYALVFVYSLRCIVEVNTSKAISCDKQFLKIIFPAAMLGTLELTYFLGRSMWAVLLCTIFPLFIILFGVLRKLWNGKVEFNEGKQVRHSAGYVGVVISVFLTIPFLTGFTTERLFRSAKPSSSNSTLLRAMFNKGYPVSSVPKNLSDNLFKIDNRWDLNFVGYPDSYRKQFNDARKMMQSWMHDEERVMIFLPQTTHLLFLSGKAHKYPISEDVCDQLSGSLVSRIVNYDAAVKEGDVIIMATDLTILASSAVSSQPVTIEKIYNLPAGHGYWWQTGYLILHRIIQDWDLYIIEKRENVIACRVSKKGVATSHYQGIKYTLE